MTDLAAACAGRARQACQMGASAAGHGCECGEGSPLNGIRLRRGRKRAQERSWGLPGLALPVLTSGTALLAGLRGGHVFRRVGRERDLTTTPKACREVLGRG